MTHDKAIDAPVGDNPAAASVDATGTPANKALWTGIGIGSAALVAALMYATKRPPRRRK